MNFAWLTLNYKLVLPPASWGVSGEVEQEEPESAGVQSRR